jgi:cytochrome c oxidase subunit 4
MSAHTLSVSTYLLVLAALLVLTVATIAVSFVPMIGFWHVVLGQSIALVKATLVVLFFMHVVLSPRVVWVVVAVTVFWLVVVFISLTFSDYFTRGLIPYLPGH